MFEYWYLWLLLGALIIATVVVLNLAGKALSSHNAQTKKILAEIDRMKALKDKYKELTAEKVAQADSKELLEGVTAVLQVRIEKADDGEYEFSQFNDTQKRVYALNYFVEDVRESLSHFFKNNGSILTDLIVDTLEKIGDTKIIDLVKTEYQMYDENNEDVSIDYSLIEETDKKFKESYSENEFLDEVKKYIESEIDNF